MTPFSRRALLIALAGALPIAALLPLWVARHELPHVVATHWSLAWTADGFQRLSDFAALMGTLAALGSGLLLTAALVWRSEAASHQLLRAGLAFVGAESGGLAATIAGWTTLTQRGLADSRAVPGPSALALAAIMLVPLLLGVAAAVLARGARSGSEDAGAPASLGLRAGESAAWMRRVAAPWSIGVVLLGIAHVVVGVLSEILAVGCAGVVLAALGVAMGSIRVSADQRGLIVRWGPLGLPRTTVPLRDIVRAEAIDIRPMEWGGWGYRGSLRVLGRAAIVMRAGPGLRLDLTSGRVLAVTVDDPRTAAGLLNDLVARFATGPAPC